MMLKPEQLIITAHPPKPIHGMITGKESVGIRIVHKPTGCAVECTKFRSHYKNKEVALVVLELLVDA